MTEKDSKKSGSVSVRHKFLYAIFIIISCISIYTYIDYLYGIRALDIVTGYVEDGKYCEKYILHNGDYYTKNSERIYKSSNRTDVTYYPEERIGTVNNTVLGKDSTGYSWLKRDLGPTPIGEKISSYEIYGTKSYISGYKPYTATRYVMEPQYRRYRNYWGEMEEEFVGFHDVPKYYTDYSPVYQTYIFSRCFSTYDISNELSFFNTDESIYNKLLDNIVKDLKENYNITPIEGTIKGHRAIIYDTHDDIPMRRVIFCANERMYILETKSTHDLFELSFNYCSNLDLSPVYKLEGNWNTNVTIPLICIFFIYCLVHLFKIRMARKKQMINKMARELYRYNFILFAISFATLCCLINDEYSEYPCVHPGIVSSISISAVFDIIVLLWLINKSNSEYTIDWIVSPWIKKHCYNKLRQEKSKRLYLSFVIYPIVILCATPLCGYAIIYGILITIIIMMIVYFNNWSEWLEGGNDKVKMQSKEDSNNYKAN